MLTFFLKAFDKGEADFQKNAALADREWNKRSADVTMGKAYTTRFTVQKQIQRKLFQNARHWISVSSIAVSFFSIQHP